MILSTGGGIIEPKAAMTLLQEIYYVRTISW